MKKIVLAVMAFSLIAVLAIGFTLSATADTNIQSGTLENLSWTLNQTTGELVISGNGEMIDLSSWSCPWNRYSSFIKSVVIQDGVTSIGAYAFYKCSALETVTIPATLTRIGDSAFSSYNRITDVYVKNLEAWLTMSVSTSYPNVLETLHFLDDNGNEITNVIIPDGVTNIDYYAFQNCTSLTGIVIPDSVVSCDWRTFKNCKKLKSVIIGNGLTSIGDGAFSDCAELSNVTIGNGVTSIGKNAFSNCTALASIALPDGLVSIGSSAFLGCKNLNEIVVSCEQDWNLIGGGESGISVVRLVRMHTWDDGVVTTHPTHLTSGVKARVCIACNATKLEGIDALSHTYGEWEPYSDTQHKKTCACGDTVYEDHAMEDGACSRCGQKNASGCSSSGAGVVFFAPVLCAACLLMRKKKK